MGGIWLVMETAVSEWTAQTLVEEQKQQSDLDAFAGQAVGFVPSPQEKNKPTDDMNMDHMDMKRGA
jgi:hypothetical protein